MTTMRLHCRGFVHMKGKAKETGKEYDFAQLMIELDMSGNQNANMQRLAFGKEAVAFDVEPSFAAKFYGFPYPCDLDVQIEEQMVKGRRGSLETRKKAVNATLATPAVPAAAKAV
ncbi:hypothetical protein [Chitinimonas taiwanensis]|uniref:Uncharacterized protein n=1 Tax=Chitinimonas taiwanensis DSM 18899 TaxID=1121279 RepID=A0A1K2HLM1_9NEIS|nr:hypothetical protein [Chitinimonas taiwanensis]SFZ77611.1 hypothetical protein SAMN02745887_02520 [Chitinimonas taiwanensis DSM 18899]